MQQTRGGISLHSTIDVDDTRNANMTRGARINRSAAENENPTFKSLKATDDPSLTDIHSFGTIREIAASKGGLEIRGYSTDAAGLSIYGIAGKDNISETTNATAYIQLNAAKTADLSTTLAAPDANLLAIPNHGATRFIFDTEGSAYADVELDSFDAVDSLAAIESLVYHATGDTQPGTIGCSHEEAYTRKPISRPRSSFSSTKTLAAAQC